MIRLTPERAERRASVLLFLAALIAYAYFFPRWADPNQNSRLNMVVAVVDDGTFQIDRNVSNTVDYAKIDGHYYSDKAPGAAWMGIPIYAGLRLLLDLPVLSRLTERLANSEAFKATLREEGSGVRTDKVRFAIAQIVLSMVTNALPTAMTVAMIFLLLGRWGGGAFAPASVRAAVALSYGLLTPAFAYANAFYGHQLSAALLFGAFFWLQMRGAAQLSAVAALGVGMLLGYSVVTEFPAVLVAAALWVYAAWLLLRAKRPLLLAPMTAGVLLCAVALMIYNNALFGGPFKLGYGNSELWEKQHGAGFMSLTMPHFDAMWGITFGAFRGLLMLSPVLALAVPGIVAWWRGGGHRAELALVGWASASMFLFNASSIMWWGGFAIGPRYVLPGLPFLALALAFVWRRPQARWVKALSLALALWSLIATWGLTLADQAFPPDNLFNPLVEYALPNWIAGNIARNLGTIAGLKGVASVMPLVMALAVLAVVWRRIVAPSDRDTRAAAPVKPLPST